MEIVKLSSIESSTKPNKEAMKAFFDKRTNKHIDLVKKYCKRIEEFDPEKFKGLCDQAKDHDQSKFKAPEYEPYLYVTWSYKCKDSGEKFEVPEEIDKAMNEATNHHVKNKKNRHHPEAHSEQDFNPINKENRDSPTGNIVDATKMLDLDVAEMVADWASVSEERKSSLKNWADNNVNIRWKFNDDQVDTIYELIKVINLDEGEKEGIVGFSNGQYDIKKGGIK